MPKQPLVYTVEVDGHPPGLFGPRSRSLRALQGSVASIGTLRAYFKRTALCLPHSTIRSRIANEPRGRRIRKPEIEAKASDEMLFAYLIELDEIPNDDQRGPPTGHADGQLKRVPPDGLLFNPEGTPA
jgi:hypothetical protein